MDAKEFKNLEEREERVIYFTCGGHAYAHVDNGYAPYHYGYCHVRHKKREIL